MSKCPSLPRLEQLISKPGEDVSFFSHHLPHCSHCQLWHTRIRRGQKIQADILDFEDTNLADIPSSSRSSIVDLSQGYDVVEELARGGQSIVYKAIQKSTNRVVAIKLLRDGRFASRLARKRFEREVEIVSSLKHPNIITIFDSGQSKDDRRYYVMDYIDGLPMDKAVKRENLTEKQILKLFTTTCEAVNYAHQRGVIHRDLKPSNVLVDARLRPYVLDFGIAKQVAAAGTHTTTTAPFVGTISYMSPEQIRDDTDDIDTRCDVYALGVILYKILTDELPYRLKGAKLSEIIRVICDENPQKPSVVKPELRDDLETIVLKALEKAPSNRYATPLAMAEDIDRYLSKQPVLARRPTTLYRLRKLIQRRRGLVALMAMVLTGAIAAGIRSNIQQAKVERAVRSSEQFYSELMDIIAISFNPTYQGAETQTWGRRLGVLARRIDAEMAGYPEGEAALRMRLGLMYIYIADLEAAELQLTKTLSLLRKLHDSDHLDIAICLRELGTLLNARNQHPEAERLHRESLAMYRRLLGPVAPELILGTVRLGGVFESRRLHEEAEEFYRAALTISRQLIDDHQEHEAICLWYLAGVLETQEKIVEAEECIRESIAIDQNSGRDLYLRPAVRQNTHHRPSLWTLSETIDSKLSLLAKIRYEHGDLESARSYAAQTLAMRRRWYTSDDPDLNYAIVNLAGLSWAHGDYATAETMIREAVAAFDEKEHESITYLICLNSLGVVLRDQGKFEEGETTLRQALRLAQKQGDETVLVANAQTNIAKLLYAKGDREAAEPLFREGLDLRRHLLPDDHRDISESLIGLGLIAMDRDDFQKAEQLIRDALRIRKKLPEDHWLYGEALSVLGACLSTQSRYGEAETLLLDGHRILTTKLLASHKLVVLSRHRLMDHYESCGQPSEAASFRKQTMR